MSAPHTHFSSPSRVIRRRKGALARLRNSVTPLEKDQRVKTNPRTQDQLDAERLTLTELASGTYQKKSKIVKAWNVND
jgi:hypothetical protein